MYYFDNFGWLTAEELPDRVTDIAIPETTLQDGFNWNFTGYEWVAQKVTPAPVVIVPIINPTEFLIDVGPFFDRFKASKMPILMSTNATVKAIVSDLQVRKWIDLKRSDVAAGIDVLIALNISGVNSTLKDAILNLPVLPEENLALRKLYFS